jgi:predicted RNase H-like HicB family nuclease
VRRGCRISRRSGFFRYPCTFAAGRPRGAGANMRQPLSFHLQKDYPYTVTPDPDGGFFIAFPDLPGCMTQVEDSSEIGQAAEEIRTLWLETAYAHEMDIPLPRANADFSGKFVVRVPRSLHRRRGAGWGESQPIRRFAACHE